MRRIGPYVSFDRLQPSRLEGHEQDGALGLTLDGYKALTIDVSWHPVTDVLDESGEVRRIPQLRWSISAQPSSRIIFVSLSGAVGRDIDYQTGTLAHLTNVVGTIRTRPIDRAEVEARYSSMRLDGDRGQGRLLNEKIVELLATWYFNEAFYALGDIQLHRSVRRLPALNRRSSSLSSLQLVWQPRLDWRAYVGVRSGASEPGVGRRGRSTELYLKLSRRIALDGI